MKLLVFAHRLELGGTQTNAIELAAALRDRHGFDILFHAAPGPAEDLLHARGLRLLPAPDVRLHPSPSRMRVLREIVRQEKPDVIHAWDWWQGLEAYCGAHLPMRTPLVITDMMMSLTRMLPRQIPTTFGVRDVYEQAAHGGWRSANFLPPPVDTCLNAPDALDRDEERAALGIAEHEIAVVTVSRLSHDMKAESLYESIRMMQRLGNALPLRLVIVGEGLARRRLSALAQVVNKSLGRKAITLTGGAKDPRGAYAAADIVIGMGGSAMRGMAFARPVIVVGTHGFARLFDHESVRWFLQNGMFGTTPTGDRAMDDAVLALAADADLRRRLGDYGRDYVLTHHTLDVLSDRLAHICRDAAKDKKPRLSSVDAARTAMVYLRERRFRSASRDRA